MRSKVVLRRGCRVMDAWRSTVHSRRAHPSSEASLRLQVIGSEVRSVFGTQRMHRGSNGFPMRSDFGFFRAASFRQSWGVERWGVGGTFSSEWVGMHSAAFELTEFTFGARCIYYRNGNFAWDGPRPALVRYQTEFAFLLTFSLNREETRGSQTRDLRRRYGFIRDD